MRRAALLALAAAGCLSLGPRAPAPRYYVLAPHAGAPPATRPPVAALGVGPVDLPPYLDRRELVTRTGPTEVEVATGARWAAPLDALFTSALAEDLRSAVPAREVLAEPWPAGAAPEWSVSIDLLRFEAERDGTAVLEARWAVRRRGEPAGAGVTTARERGAAGDPAAAVAALSRTVDALAREIAQGIDAARAEAPR